VNERTYRLLEYDAVLGDLARYSLSDEAAGRIRETRPLDSPEAVEQLKAQVAAVLALMRGG
jgi:dsDNA-specific endonuclease/ATPase MutS2